ncbi:MAG: Mur ligase domain-containing protein [Verrucomicrobia bacterium]|nr:Mur ligase domain-containing protein [Verrucomicrobiota bacterium]
MVPPGTATPINNPDALRTAACRSNGAALLLQRAARPNNRNMTLHQILDPIPLKVVQGQLDCEVRAICTDSRRASPGCVFFCRGGRKFNGNDFIEDAVHRGAIAVVTDKEVWAPQKNHCHPRGQCCPGTRHSLQRVLWSSTIGAGIDRYHRHRWQNRHQLSGASVSGTGEPVGLLGTNQYILGQRTLPAYRTTPEPTDLYAMLAQMHAAGCKQSVLEISSHGIDQGRVLGLPLHTAVFLNLSPEHLDYHGDMENYYQVKKALFDGRNGPLPQHAVINLDDPYGERLARDLPAAVKPLTFGLSKAADIRQRRWNIRKDPPNSIFAGQQARYGLFHHC